MATPHASKTSATLSAEDTKRLQAALDQYNRGDLTQAKPVLLDLAQRYRGQAEVQAAAGMALAESGDVNGALLYLQRAHRLQPQDAALTVNLAVAEIKLGSAGEAVPLLRSAAEQQPRAPDIHILLAQALLAVGRSAEAAAAYGEADRLIAVSHQQSPPDLRHDWAVALLRSNRPADAVRVLQDGPGERSAGAEELLGEAEEKEGHFEVAVGHFKRAAEQDSNEANLFAYGNELLQHWTFPAAIEVFRYATERFPGNSTLQTSLGIAYFGNANYDRAIPVFSALLAAQPNSAIAADLLGRSCGALASGVQPGCSSLQQFAEAHPQNAPASLYAAVSILHRPLDQQDPAAAETLLKNALRVDPRLDEAWYQMAVLQQSRNEWQKSAESLARAIALRPAFAEAHYRLARAYSHLGKRDEAQQEITLQQRYVAESKAAENRRMHDVITFVTSSN